MKKLNEYQYCLVFDLETTGFDPLKNTIIELSLIVIDSVTLSPTKSHSHFIKIKEKIPLKITSLTGITQAMTEKGIDDLALYKIFETYNHPNCLWMAYNIQFDIGFVEAHLQKFKSTFKGHVLDVMAIYKDQQKPPHALKNAISTYNIVFQNTHRATDDVLATIEVLKALNQEVNVSEYINAIGYHPNYGLKGPAFPWVNYYPQENIRNDLHHKIQLNKGEVSCQN
jgi:DNA polymerase III alpha subunit (gram-positive type)